MSTKIERIEGNLEVIGYYLNGVKEGVVADGVVLLGGQLGG